ncbi:hypothetical protein C882_2308 [Caenispirillum salinarum AK4]|uniref:Uncharacterized protein n=1 Tax=Caenispirillum salinarum AK4 TaxID=1238182 RepID=K9GKI2_9PROT|nr:DUF2793 domain-containing protein [Caenispirillum salinarum]EKV26535.1 hypothetical protein C882_2308 [Caenispirillum salinarum AK4]
MTSISGFYTPSTYQNTTALGQNLQLRKSISDLQTDIARLQEQQATGKKAFTHGDLGSESNVVQGLRQKVSGLDGYLRTISQVSTRTEGIQGALDVLQQAGDRLGINGMTALNTDADIQLQQIPREAQGALESMITALNSNIDGRYVFAGAETQTRPVTNQDAIMNGTPGKMGLKEFSQLWLDANVGDDGMGRLSITRGEGVLAPETLSLKSEGGVFGLKLRGVEIDGSASMPGLYETANGARGDLTFTGPGAPGDQVDLTFELPDGTETTIVMKGVSAKIGTPPTDVVEYEIGDTAEQTAINFRVALEARVKDLVAGEVSGAASAAAADSFFEDNPPRIPEGDPATGATRLASAGNTTVKWYNGPGMPNVTVDGHIQGSAPGLPALNDAPANPKAGDQFLVGATPTGGDPFDTHAGEIATWDGTAWSFAAPTAGTRAVADTNANWDSPPQPADLRGQIVEYDGANWQVFDPGTDGVQVLAGDQAGGDRSDAVMRWDAGTSSWSVVDPQPTTLIDDNANPKRIGTYDGFAWTWTTPELGQEIDDTSVTPAATRVWDGSNWAPTGRGPEDIPEARDTVIAKVDDGTYVSYGARANETAFVDTLKAAAILAAVEHGGDNADHYHALASRAAPNLKSAAAKVIDTRTAIGVTEDRLNTLKNRHEDVGYLTEQQVNRIEKADEYEVATSLLDAMNQLQATYSITGKLSQLTLANFL